jgi:hypothetical protein
MQRLALKINVAALLFLSVGCHGGKSAGGGVDAGGVGASSGGGSGTVLPTAGTNGSLAGTTETGAGGSTGGTSGAGGVVAGTGSAADFESRYIHAFCTFFVRCGVSQSVETCKTDYFDSGTTNLAAIKQDIESGRTLYNAEQGIPCFNAIANAPCAQGVAFNGHQLDAICGSVIRGTVADGGRCVTEAECASGSCYQPSCSTSCCLGTCQAIPTTGTTCSSTSDCAPTDFCSYLASPSSHGVCQPRVAQGQPCEYDNSCLDGLNCDSAGTKTCVPYVKDGQPCNSDMNTCENLNSFCDGVTHTCRPRLALGAACSMPDGGFLRISAGCPFYADCIGGKCVAMPRLGEACTVPDGGSPFIACLSGTCTNGLCQPSANPPCTLANATTPDAGARD